jgi:dihydrodipicolinate synthase/N-acetylneuraminate lyase
MWLELMGLPQGPVRPPLIPLTSEEMFQLKQDLESLELIGTAEVTS